MVYLPPSKEVEILGKGEFVEIFHLVSKEAERTKVDISVTSLHLSGQGTMEFISRRGLLGSDSVYR
jgi:hypothetical protein